MKTKSTIFLLALALLLFGTMLNAQTATPPVGDGSSGSPYEIASLDNLYWVTQNSGEWSKHYIQTADIDASSTSGWDGGAGFATIGNGSVQFSGSYDGQTHTIDGLTINRSGSSSIGMFGNAEATAEIKNLGLTNVNITGGKWTGGLLGRTQAGTSVTISDCYVTGSVTVNGTTSGGFVGYFHSTASITNCWTAVTINVSGSATTVLGGFVGYTNSGSTISECYSTGDVNGGSYQRVGGFAGTPNGTIENCYSSSNVTAANYKGGFVGRNYTNNIINCYCTGTVSSGGSKLGGFGYPNGKTFTDCYWDVNTSGMGASGDDNGGATGKTTAAMKDQATFTNWDFTNIWEMDGYPKLKGATSTSENNPPTANAGTDQTLSDSDGDGVESVTLDGSGSSDSDGTIVSYLWKEGSNELATVEKPTLDLAVGNHTITLTVTDDSSATASDEVVINVETSSSVKTLSFPTAEGGGAYTLGGRGGAVIEVTNLNSEGAGSFREACMSTGARTIVFRVGGTIDLEGKNIELGEEHSYLTIAGQTAPGGGIQIRNGQLFLAGINNVIVRYIRFRLGPVEGSDDALGATRAENIIFDHVSAFWGIDETLSVTNHSKNITIQWCIIAEGLNESWCTGEESWDPWYDDGTTKYWAHSRGTMVTAYTENASVHHNLIYNHYKRIPLIQNSKAEVINNVIINKDAKETIVSTKDHFDTQVNWIGNYYRFYSHAHKPIRVYNYKSNNSGCYYKDNYDAHFRPDDRYSETSLREFGTTDYKIEDKTVPYAFDGNPVTTKPVHDAYTDVLDKAGAILPFRDEADVRVVKDVRDGNVPSSLVNAHTVDALTWPTLESGVAPTDSDHDGMPDSWETSKGLNPNDASDRNGTNLSSEGYTNLEVYLNNITTTDIGSNNAENINYNYELSNNYPNPFNPTTVIHFTLSQSGQTNLSVYNILGQEVSVLVNRELKAGSHSYSFNGSGLSSGIYFYKLQSSDFVSVKKMMLVK